MPNYQTVEPLPVHQSIRGLLYNPAADRRHKRCAAANPARIAQGAVSVTPFGELKSVQRAVSTQSHMAFNLKTEVIHGDLQNQYCAFNAKETT